MASTVTKHDVDSYHEVERLQFFVCFNCNFSDFKLKSVEGRYKSVYSICKVISRINVQMIVCKMWGCLVFCAKVNRMIVKRFIQQAILKLHTNAVLQYPSGTIRLKCRKAEINCLHFNRQKLCIFYHLQFKYIILYQKVYRQRL